MASILLVAGPPVSARLWDGVADRLRQLGHDANTIELFDPAPADPSVPALAATLRAALAGHDHPILVAHGTVLPVALAAAQGSDLGALVLTNGALGGLHPLTRALCAAARIPGVVSKVALHPRLWQRWLASSVGLRRAVVNPYVMDRDTVVALSAPYLQSGAHRRAVTQYLAELPAAVAEVPAPDVATLVLWGDEDPLQPMHVADSARRWLPRAVVEAVPGGQHLHPVERPWAFADALDAWWRAERSTVGATP
jgi:pimeloyl-ACP methyl ester carboxylesterase